MSSSNSKGLGGFANGVIGLSALLLLGWIVSPSDEERAAARAANAERAAEAEHAARDAEYACTKDIKCLAEKHEKEAFIQCSMAIERAATYDFEWVSGWSEKRFSRTLWANDGKSILYRGDAVKFQGENGAWHRHRYECEFDPLNEKIIELRADVGRW